MDTKSELAEHCKQCAEVVKTWPESKRDCLGKIAAPVVERQEPVGFVIPGNMPSATGYTLTLNPVAEGRYTEPLYTSPPAPVAVVCAHEWTDDGEFTLICTKCGKEENHEPYGWLQTHGDEINAFTQEWDVVLEWEDRGFEYVAMFEHAALSPAALALPDRATDFNASELMKRIGKYGDVAVWHGADIWNACLDKVKELNNG